MNFIPQLTSYMILDNNISAHNIFGVAQRQKIFYLGFIPLYDSIIIKIFFISKLKNKI